MVEFQCLDCESWSTEEEWDERSSVCPHCGEGQCLEFALRRDEYGELPTLDCVETLGWVEEVGASGARRWKRA